jgi:D-alanine transfer protein
MTRADTNKEMPHLFAGLIALGLAGTILFAAEKAVIHLERATVFSTAPDLFLLKTQGLAFQRAAARAVNVLPIYGSSELLVPTVPEKGNDFFRTAPTGFQLSPVGNGGMAPLIILQKVAALGWDLRGKELAISLSPGLTASPGRKAYEGNFSRMAASEMVFGAALDFDLKREIASRMLECPSTLEKSPLLEFALRRLASGRWLDRVVFCALWPIGKAQNAVLEMQDHFAALDYIRHEIKPAPRRHLEIIDWPKLIAKVSALKTADEGKQTGPDGLGVRLLMRMDAAAPGWTHLELLLRTLASVHARPLLLSMPIDGQFYDQAGVSRSAREGYYERLRTLAQRYNFELLEFKDHDEDPAFLIRHGSHLTTKGWIYYDRALDDFFHGRLPRS